MFTTIAYAQTPGATEAASFVATLNQVILFPVIFLLTGVALLVFMYGSFVYIANANNPAAREVGQKHIMWSIIGLFVMLSAFAILSLAANTLGLGNDLECADNPNASGCDLFLSPGGGGGNTGGGGGNTGGGGGNSGGGGR